MASKTSVPVLLYLEMELCWFAGFDVSVLVNTTESSAPMATPKGEVCACRGDLG
ncbi:MAG: hypothetical protein IPG50_11645 [Myxococcales bacterium]|nr:hypothetical protein [Myxococcales bacterium]